MEKMRLWKLTLASLVLSLVSLLETWHSLERSLDVRRGRSGRHWWNEQRFGRRVRFLLPATTSFGGVSSSSSSSSSTRNSTAASLARLQIVNVTRQDGGEYRCRVDFNDAPSRNFKYRLVVIGEFPFFFLLFYYLTSKRYMFLPESQRELFISF